MKTKNDVDNLVESLNHDTFSLAVKIFEAHAFRRKSVAISGIGISKVISIWMRVSKQQF
jgi:hypothetical protein